MNRLVLLVLPAALLTLAAAPAPKSQPASRAAKAPGTAAAKPPAGPFDATNPQGLIGVLEAAGARAQPVRREADAVFVTVTSPAANFSLQFAGCDRQGRACQAVLLDAPMERGSATSAQVNGFNQTSAMCRIYQDKGGLPHVVYSAVLFRSTTRADAATHLQAWQGCLADGRDFLRDPVGYLANAA